MLEAVFGITALTLAFAAPSYAETDTANIDKREASQGKRIGQGAKSGAVSPKKDAKLNAEQAKIDRMEDKANADGHLTKQRKHISKEQNLHN